MPFEDPLSRRSLLKGAAILGAGVVAAELAGCSSSSKSTAPPAGGTSVPSTTPTTAPKPAVIRKPGSRPNPTLPEGTDTIPQIEHIIIVQMENHSYDDHFGMLGRGDGYRLDSSGTPVDANPDGTGKYVKAFHMPSTCQLQGLPGQDWVRSHTSWNNGRNDGFVKASTAVAMGYWDESDIPFYYALAKTFPVCDRFFCSVLAQTYPNRRFMLAGTAAGIVSTSINALQPATQPPNGSIFDRLQAHKIPWKNYFTDLPGTAVIPSTLAKYEKNLVKIDQFYADAAAGKLPAVSYVDPNFDHDSEENDGDIRAGEAFVAKVINAVMQSPNWSKTVLIYNYDEHGGYYDHVPPPPAIKPDNIAPGVDNKSVHGAYDRYGFRVPAVIVSPYARKDYVSHVVHDHTSTLKLIETKWNLGAMTYRDANASDLLDSLDFTVPPAFAEPPTLPAAGAAGTCTPGKPGGPIPPASAVVAGSAASSLRIGATA
jgi:phospholipase C